MIYVVRHHGAQGYRYKARIGWVNRVEDALAFRSSAAALKAADRDVEYGFVEAEDVSVLTSTMAASDEQALESQASLRSGGNGGQGGAPGTEETSDG